jgi:hypothetical protein
MRAADLASNIGGDLSLTRFSDWSDGQLRYTRNGQLSSIATTYTYFSVASSSLTLAQMSSWKTLL